MSRINATEMRFLTRMQNQTRGGEIFTIQDKIIKKQLRCLEHVLEGSIKDRFSKKKT